MAFTDTTNLGTNLVQVAYEALSAATFGPISS